MFSWLTERLKSFSQSWKGFKRRKTYRKKRAPIVSVPVPHEKIGKVQKRGPYRSDEKDTKLLKNLMIAVVGVIIVLIVLAVCLVAEQVKNAGGVQWEWLNEFMGNSQSSSETEVSSAASFYEDEDDPLLLIADEKSPLPEDFTLSLAEVEGISVDERMKEDLTAMLSAMREQGLEIKLVSGYISPQEQEAIYQQKLQEYSAQGYSKVRAEAAAASYQSGCSEFQIGLTIQLALPQGGNFAESQACTWLKSYAGDYGFVFRYPEGKKNITGLDADPSFLRYVGQENADQMRRMEMCLEEYTEYISER